MARRPGGGSRRTSTRRAQPAQSQDEKEEVLEFDGRIVEALPNAMFSIQLDNGHQLIAYASGRMRKFFIRILPGDRVRVSITPYDLNRGRITYRYRD